MGRATRISWSHTRSSMLAECPRKAFYEYYSEGETGAGDVWRLRELIPLPMWAGTAVDVIISRALDYRRKNGEIKSDLAAAGIRLYRKGLEKSREFVSIMRSRPRTKEERDASDFQPLQHDYYKLDIGEDYIESMESRVFECLNSFENSETYERIKDVHCNHWGWLSKIDGDVAPSFKLEGYKVYAAYDFWFRDGESLHILDWKTGADKDFARQAADRQLGVYALYGAYELRHPLDRIHTQAVWLQGTADWNPKQVDKSALKDIRDGIISEIRSEIEMLDVRRFKVRTEYIASIESFPARPNTRACTNCKYRELCPEGRDVCSHIKEVS